MAWARLRLARFTSMPTELFLCHYPNRAMSESVDYKKKYMEAQLELIDTKARLATIESMYWKQQKMMNDDQADHENYKEQYLVAKQKNEELRKIMDQQGIGPLNYKEMYESAVRDERKMRKELSQEVEKFKAKYEKAKEALAAKKKPKTVKKSKPSPSKTELKLKSRVESLENLLKHYKEEGLKALMNSEII